MIDDDDATHVRTTMFRFVLRKLRGQPPKARKHKILQQYWVPSTGAAGRNARPEWRDVPLGKDDD